MRKIVTVTVDRPLGSVHPNHSNIVYPINYGYIDGVVAEDGEFQDAYIIGIDEPVESFTGEIIATIIRHNDAENKLVVAPPGSNFTKEEIIKLTHFQEQYFEIDVVMEELWDVYDENKKLTGETMLRREQPSGKYHLVVHIWIKNSKNQWLISKRTANKHFPLKWECTGGSVLAGEDSITGAVREVKEELGITLDKSKGRLYKSIKRPIHPDFCDVWIFEHDCSIDDVVLQEGETCDAMWASSERVKELIDKNEFVPLNDMQYVFELL